MRTYSRVSSEKSFWRIAVNKVVNSGSAGLEIFQLEDVAGNCAIFQTIRADMVSKVKERGLQETTID